MFLRVHFLLFVLFLPLSVHADQLTGRVVAISDGDTLTILDESKTQIKIRLAGIDSPESRQPYGTKAKQELSELAFNRMVKVTVETRDRYKRIIGRVYVDGILDVNAELIKRGAAWVYPQYANDPALYALEHEARINQRGLWKLPNHERVPPWLWRKFKRSKSSNKQSLILTEHLKAA